MQEPPARSSSGPAGPQLEPGSIMPDGLSEDPEFVLRLYDTILNDVLPSTPACSGSQDGDRVPSLMPSEWDDAEHAVSGVDAEQATSLAPGMPQATSQPIITRVGPAARQNASAASSSVQELVHLCMPQDGGQKPFLGGRRSSEVHQLAGSSAAQPCTAGVAAMTKQAANRRAGSWTGRNRPEQRVCDCMLEV
jgi:hypothetical protein